MPKKPPHPLEYLNSADNGPSYFEISADDGSQSSKALASYNVVQRSNASFLGYDLSNLQPNVSARPEFTRSMYSLYRPSEAIPRKYTDKLIACDQAYKNFGIVRNTIDLMSDFACSGIRISHPRPAVQKFLRRWWKFVKGADRSERFLSSLFKLGTAVVRMQTGKLPLKEKRNINNALAEDIEFKRDKLPKREIPAKYTFLHPALVRSAGGPFSGFMVKDKLVLDIPRNLKIQLKKLKDSDILKSIPQEIRNSLESNKPIPLDEQKTFISYFKKDDWEERSDPIIFPILKPLIMLDKLALADSTALDGAISKIRIFKLGNLDYDIAPTAAAVNKLNEILEAHTGGGTIDLIWGPDIELIESNSDTYQFLGDEKYKPHLNDVYVGLGIPITLTGSGSGTTNNFISLKTLIKRLEYGRKKLVDFWQEQLRLVQLSMGFRDEAIIEFDMDSFGDEAAHNRLLIEMCDRNLISEELLQEKFGHNPELEKTRINRENKEREDDKRVKKAGPFHDSQFDIALKKIALQQKLITPKQAGLELEEDSEQTPFDKQLEVQKQRQANSGGTTNKNKKSGENGRPAGKKDSQKRKTKNFKPQVRAVVEVWADDAQSKINDILKPYILKEFSKKNMRSLTTIETEQAEQLKAGVLYNIDPMIKVNADIIEQSLNKPIRADILKELRELKSEVATELDRELTFAEIGKLKTLLYMKHKGIENE